MSDLLKTRIKPESAVGKLSAAIFISKKARWFTNGQYYYKLLKPRPIISLELVIIIKAVWSISLIFSFKWWASYLLQTVSKTVFER